MSTNLSVVQRNRIRHMRDQLDAMERLPSATLATNIARTAIELVDATTEAESQMRERPAFLSIPETGLRADR